jgi:hypothetical protein
MFKGVRVFMLFVVLTAGVASAATEPSSCKSPRRSFRRGTAPRIIDSVRRLKPHYA